MSDKKEPAMVCMYQKRDGAFVSRVFEKANVPKKGWKDSPAELEGWKPGSEIKPVS